MGKTVYYCAATLDGYIADKDDGIDWLMGYEGSYESDEGSAPGPMADGGSYDSFYEGVGVLISGSTTYEFVVNHIKGGGRWPYSGKPYWVLSSRELPVPAGEDDGIRILDASVPEIIDELRAVAGDRDIWVVGGGNVASQFADAGLLDELHLTVVPVVLGEGKPLFNRAVPGAPMQLLDTRAFGNGMVELRYTTKR